MLLCQHRRRVGVRADPLNMLLVISIIVIVIVITIMITNMITNMIIITTNTTTVINNLKYLNGGIGEDVVSG